MQARASMAPRLPSTGTSEDWWSAANCRGADAGLFFAVGTGADALRKVRAAKALCRACPVAGPCLEYALASDESGVWGGTAENERRGTRAQVRREECRPCDLPMGCT